MRWLPSRIAAIFQPHGVQRARNEEPNSGGQNIYV